MKKNPSPTTKEKKKYKTENWKEYDKALKARGSLTVWLDKDMKWQAQPTGKRGRQQQYSDEAIEFCLMLKALFGLPLRQSMGLVQSVLKLSGLDWAVPQYSTVSRRQKQLEVKLPYRAKTTGLALLVDSTGVKFMGDGEWKRKKHGVEQRRQWRKVHLAIDADTFEIRAVEVTDNSIGDAPMLPQLLSQIPEDEPIDSVTGDGAYDSKECHRAIAQRGARAIIPPRKNARQWKEQYKGDEVRNAASTACRELGRELWKQQNHYHRRSLVETKMHCFKRLGDRLTARTFERQTTEVHIRVAILNRFTRMGRPHSVAAV